MFGRFVLVLCLLVALTGGVVAAAPAENARACPEDGNPSQGLETSVSSSGGNSLHAVDGINTAFERVGCPTRY